MAGSVTLGGHRYGVVLSEIVRKPINSMRQMQDQGGEVGEQSLDNSALWRRKSDDFVIGQGQKFLDQSDESDRRRMRAVSGFDPLANRRALAVALTCSNVVAAYAGGTAGAPKLLKTASNWWMVPTGSGTIKRSTSFTNFTTQNISGTTAAKDATVFGSTVYVCDGASVFSGSITGTSVSSYSTHDTDVIDAVKGRLICGHDNLLFELTSAGATQVEVFTHPDSSWAWVDFEGGNVGIYAAGHNGLKSEIYLTTLVDATGALQPPSSAYEFPDGELVRSIDTFQQHMVIGTNLGVHVAQLTQSGLLSVGPLIELGDTYGVVFEGQYAYVTCSSLPVFTGPGVVKMDMARFSGPLTPAYAGAFPISASGYTAYDVGVQAGQVVCLLGNSTNVQLASTASTYGTGYYWSGEITFGTDEPKNVHSASVVFDALTSGQSVTLSIYDKQGGTQLATTSTSTVGATSLELTGFSEILREAYEIYIVAAGAVTVRRWTTRAVVAPDKIPEEILLPVLMSRENRLDNGTTVNLDTRDEWTYLVGLQQTKTPTTLLFGEETLTVWVDQVGVDRSWTRWDASNQWPEGIVWLRLVTVL